LASPEVIFEGVSIPCRCGSFVGLIELIEFILSQFIKSRSQEVTEAVIRGATVGMKEADTSLISVLNNLFTPLTRKRVKELALTEAEELRYVGRLSREVDGCGRESSIAVGSLS
jgi:chromosome transmission fidelity protein 18